jgi:hypothetical protein
MIKLLHEIVKRNGQALSHIELRSINKYGVVFLIKELVPPFEVGVSFLRHRSFHALLLRYRNEISFSISSVSFGS